MRFGTFFRAQKVIQFIFMIYSNEESLSVRNAEHNLGTVNIWSRRRRKDISGHFL